MSTQAGHEYGGDSGTGRPQSHLPFDAAGSVICPQERQRTRTGFRW